MSDAIRVELGELAYELMDEGRIDVYKIYNLKNIKLLTTLYDYDTLSELVGWVDKYSSQEDIEDFIITLTRVSKKYFNFGCVLVCDDNNEEIEITSEKDIRKIVTDVVKNGGEVSGTFKIPTGTILSILKFDNENNTIYCERNGSEINLFFSNVGQNKNIFIEVTLTELGEKLYKIAGNNDMQNLIKTYKSDEFQSIM